MFVKITNLIFFFIQKAYPLNSENDWKEDRIKFFKNLILNRTAEIYVKTNKNWPIFFCKLLIKIKTKDEKNSKEVKN